MKDQYLLLTKNGSSNDKKSISNLQQNIKNQLKLFSFIDIEGRSSDEDKLNKLQTQRVLIYL